MGGERQEHILRGDEVVVLGNIFVVLCVYVSKVQTPMMCALPKASIHMRCRLHMGRKVCVRRVTAWTVISQRSEL